VLKIVNLVIQIILLYIIYLIGVWIQETLHLFIPGSIIGMLLLFMLLCTNMIKINWFDTGAQWLIQNLPLFFLPVTVGIITFFHIFLGKGFFILVIVIVSTFLVMITTGRVGQGLVNRKVRENE
jgi:holin-like protein